MPMYDFECKVCGKRVELNVSISDRDNHKDCDLCNVEGSVRRLKGLGNNGGFRLLGSGWESDNYATHYGDTPAGKRGDAI